MKPLGKMTVKELQKLAAELGVPGRSKLRKPQLIAAIEAARSDVQDDKASAAEAKPETIVAAVANAVVKTAEAVADAVVEVVEAATDAVLDAETEFDPKARRHPHEKDVPLLPPLELGGIPIGYNRDHLSMMVQDPTSVFCYWSFSDGTREDFFASGQPQVRLYDVTDDAKVLVRTEKVDPNAGRWFIHGLAPDRQYQAEIGVDDTEGFAARMSSTVMATPPIGPSRIEDAVFITIAPQQHMETIESDLRTLEGHFSAVTPDQHAGASEREHATAVGDSHDPTPLPLAPAPSYTTHGQPDDWGLNGSSWGAHSGTMG